MSQSIAALLLATFAASGLAGASQTQPAPQKKTAAPSQKKTSAAKPPKGASVHTSKAKSSSSKKKSTKASAKSAPRKPVRPVQQVPTPERYREIQRALAAKGYFNGEANGTWGPDSTEALKRFQKDQGLAGDGKLDSLTIIGLGLGPQRSNTAQVRPQQ